MLFSSQPKCRIPSVIHVVAYDMMHSMHFLVEGSTVLEKLTQTRISTFPNRSLSVASSISQPYSTFGVLMQNFLLPACCHEKHLRSIQDKRDRDHEARQQGYSDTYSYAVDNYPMYSKFPTTLPQETASRRNSHGELRLQNEKRTWFANILHGGTVIHRADYGVMQFLAVGTLL
jgi:hypothetical protein